MTICVAGFSPLVSMADACSSKDTIFISTNNDTSASLIAETSVNGAFFNKPPKSPLNTEFSYPGAQVTNDATGSCGSVSISYKAGNNYVCQFDITFKPQNNWNASATQKDPAFICAIQSISAPPNTGLPPIPMLVINPR